MCMSDMRPDQAEGAAAHALWGMFHKPNADMAEMHFWGYFAAKLEDAFCENSVLYSICWLVSIEEAQLQLVVGPHQSLTSRKQE